MEGNNNAIEKMNDIDSNILTVDQIPQKLSFTPPMRHVSQLSQA